MRGLSRILLYGLPYKGYALLNILFNIFYALFSGLAFVSLIPMLEVLFGNNKPRETPPEYAGIENLADYLKEYMDYYISVHLEQDRGQTLFVVIGIVLITFLLKNLSNYFALFFITFLRNGILRDLRNALYKKIIALPVSFFSEKRKGDLMSRMTTDISEIQVSFLSILEVLIRDPLTIVFSLFFMVTISVELTLFVLISIPSAGVIISQIGKRLKKDSLKLQKEQGHFLSIMDETIHGQKVIKTFGAEKRFINQFFNSTQQFYRFSNRFFHRANLASPLSEFLGICIIGVLLWFGGKMVLMDSTLSGTFFISYMGLAYNILTPAKNISKATYSIKKGNAAAERIQELFEVSSNEDAPNAIIKTQLNSSIVFKDVYFRYQKDWVIENISFTINKGQTVALVGTSGSGKTTIMNLLNRFYDINKGQLLIDDTPIDRIRRSDLFGMISLVTQESILFNDTVRNNLLIGKPDAKDPQIVEATKVANAHDFIEKLPNGYDTIIGESGNILSGGQKQRLCIARAVLKNPEILILDEATSSLDTQSEKLVQDALEKLLKNRTSLVIAHRLSTIKKANQILVLDDGKIIESGTHQSLIEKKSFYRKLVNLQTLT